MIIRRGRVVLAALAVVSAVTALVPGPATATARLSATAGGTVSSFETATILPDTETSFIVDATPHPNAVFDVSLLPIKPSGATGECIFRVNRTWYGQRPNGTRQFGFNLTNVGFIGCRTRVVVGATDVYRSWSTGQLQPGAERGWRWNNANPLSWAYLAGLAPHVASATSDCRMEVTRTWYMEQPGGEREFYLKVRNVGSTACTGDVLLARRPPVLRPSASQIAPGRSIKFNARISDPLDPGSVVLAGLSPQGATTDQFCRMEVVDRRYFDTFSTSPGKFIVITVQNTGNIPCSVRPIYVQF